MSDREAHDRTYTIFHEDGPITLTEHVLVNEYMTLREKVAASQETWTIKKRLDYLASLFGVPHGGKYAHNWRAAANYWIRTRDHDTRLREAVVEYLDAEAYVPLNNAEDQYEATSRLGDARNRLRELVAS